MGKKLDWGDAGEKKWADHAGCLLVGTKGMLHSTGHNASFSLLPEADFKEFKYPDPILPRGRGHEQEWLDACKGGPAPMSSFEYASRLTEFNLLGNVATQFDGQLEFDPSSWKSPTTKRPTPPSAANTARAGHCKTSIVGNKEMKISTWMLILFSSTTLAQVSPDQAAKIEAAIPKAARVIPQKPRKVLIWNTPFMDKSPHKGYTIPHSELAFRLMGQKTKAYEPVVSDDIAMFLPDNHRSLMQS